MKCEDFRPRIHEFIDSYLSASEMALMEAHRKGCDRCDQYFQELQFVSRAVSEKVFLPESSARAILGRASAANSLFVFRWLLLLKTKWVDFWRDLEPGCLWARASALPISLVFLSLLVGSLAPIRVERLAYLIVSAPPWNVENSGAPVVLHVDVVQRSVELADLVDTAWRLPYEDSLSLVAEIKPGGHAEINSVLEFPRSSALMDAVGSSLRESQFQEVGELASPFLIYSFQKIDVYEPLGL